MAMVDVLPNVNGIRERSARTPIGGARAPPWPHTGFHCACQCSPCARPIRLGFRRAPRWSHCTAQGLPPDVLRRNALWVIQPACPSASASWPGCGVEAFEGFRMAVALGACAPPGPNGWRTGTGTQQRTPNPNPRRFWHCPHQREHNLKQTTDFYLGLPSNRALQHVKLASNQTTSLEQYNLNEQKYIPNVVWGRLQKDLPSCPPEIAKSWIPVPMH